MHLMDILALRSIPGEALSMAITRRCPLSCAHCSSNSTMQSEQLQAEKLERFVRTFTRNDHPTFMAMSGGEALLRPALVRRLAEQARAVGTRSSALSGMYWARSRTIPTAIRKAIGSLDHFSASLDVFHEQEVARTDVFRALETVIGDGIDVSIHLLGLDADDPYLESAVDEIQRVFEGQVPILVNGVNAMGRAREWFTLPQIDVELQAEANPCTLAVWPVVAFNGTIVGCGNDDVVDGPAPEHLTVGHIDTTGWPELRRRVVESAMLRAIRTVGPEYLADRFSASQRCSGYCTTCRSLGTEPAIGQAVELLMARPTMKTLERFTAQAQQDAGPVTFIRRYGLGRYAHLVALGHHETTIPQSDLVKTP